MSTGRQHFLMSTSLITSGKQSASDSPVPGLYRSVEYKTQGFVFPYFYPLIFTPRKPQTLPSWCTGGGLSSSCISKEGGWGGNSITWMHGGMQGTFETSFTWGSPLSRSGDCGFAQRGPGTLEVLIAGTFSEVPSAQDTLARKPRTLRVNGSDTIVGHQGLRGIQ